MWFDTSETTVVKGSHVTITCRSNKEADLSLAYNDEKPLASLSGTNVITHTFTNVQEKDAGILYCIGMSGEDKMEHDVKTYNLTVCK